MEHDIDEAKAKLSQLIECAMAGEEVIIVKAGKPVRIDPTPKRTLGTAKGAVQYAEGWDAPMTNEELRAFLK